MKTLIAATAALLLLAGAGAASAAASETASVAVRTDRLDPSNPRDAERIMKRIDTAALEVCGAYRGSFVELKRVVAASDCHRDAVANAVAQLKSSQAALGESGSRSR
ncbi:UrcA family protein [Caulobacter sp. LARHSG274]